MGENTKIEWARHTFNPWVGCTKLAHPKGSACDHCYAAAWAKRTGHPELWEGERRRTTESNWKQPIKWDAAAKAAGERHTVFCASLADVFDNQVDVNWRIDLFALIRATPNLIWLLLTKRPENIFKMANACGGLPANAALGTTVEDQERADHRIPHLLRAKASLKPLFVFLSCEPLIGPISLRWAKWDDWNDDNHVRRPTVDQLDGARMIDWVIVGGESGGKARLTNPHWVRQLRDQCAEAGVAFFFKQWGEHAPFELKQPPVNPRKFYVGGKGYDYTLIKGRVEDHSIAMVRLGKKGSGRKLDGIEHNAMPSRVTA